MTTRLGSLRSHIQSLFGRVLDQFRVAYGSLLGHFGDHIGVTCWSLLGHFWIISGITLGSLLGHSWTLFLQTSGTFVALGSGPAQNLELEALDPTVREVFFVDPENGHEKRFEKIAQSSGRHAQTTPNDQNTLYNDILSHRRHR